MTKTFLFLAALTIQTMPAQNPFQQHGWVSTPGSTPFTVRTERPDGQTGPVMNRPFSATEIRHSTQTLADGTHVDHTDTSAFYRDAQGRMRTESPSRVIIYDPVAGFTYNLDPKNRIYEKWTLGAGPHSTSIAVIGDSTWVNTHSGTGQDPMIKTIHPQNGRLPMHSERVAQVASEDLAPQSVNGVGAKGTRITMTIPTGAFGNDRDVKVVHERWYSDDLQVLVKTSNSDPRFGVTTYDLTNIVQVAPLSSVFQVPADYTERARRH